MNAACSFAQQNQQLQHYKNPNLSTDQRVSDLLGRMTLEEKVGQLRCTIQSFEGIDTVIARGVGNIGVITRQDGPRESAERTNAIQKFSLEKTRLGIPILLHDEGLHGLIGKEATSFPQAIGIAATWNPELANSIAHVIARQSRTRGIRQLLSPVINIARDVRWGRVEETYGEDPYLTTQLGVAFCKGLEEENIISTPKHFAANVGDGGRDSHPINFNERLFREIYFPAFKACFQDAHATSVMAAYNSIDGIPCSENRWLLTDILRKEWGFGGFVVSDYGSAGGCRDLHHTSSFLNETAKRTLEAGLDIELPGVYVYGDSFLVDLKRGIISTSLLDSTVAHILRAKFRLGLFDHPYVDADGAAKENDTPDQRALALDAARQSIVLLKNENNLLPLSKNIKSVAVIGPNADEVRLGGYSGFGMKVITVLEGIKNKVSSGTNVLFAKGCDLGELALPTVTADHLIPDGEKPGQHGLKGEYFNNQNLSGTPALVRIDKQLNFDWGGGTPADSIIPTDHFSVRWTGMFVSPVSGKYKFSITTDDGVRLFIDGILKIDHWIDRSATPDYFTLNLKKDQKVNLRIEYYENGGGASITLGWNGERDNKKEMDRAVTIAKKADAVIFVGGIIEGEGQDRADLNLNGRQEELLHDLIKTGKPIVVVLMAGSAVTMKNWIDDVPAVLDLWYGGEEGGSALADVLFGDYNPAGRLPITFPQSVGQCPLYYNTKPSGRGYDYVTISGKPLFPFGYGLSYTKFEYSNLKIQNPKASQTENIHLGVEVRNIGTRAGDEVVQLYLHDQVASVVRPVKELKGFQRITLAPQESKTVVFTLTPDDLSMFDKDLKSVVEPGMFDVMIGSSSEDIRVKEAVEVVGQ